MTNFTKEDFQFGDVIIVRNNSFLSKGIRWFMKKAYKTPMSKTFSHVAVVVNIWGEKWIVEALGWGVRVWTLEESGYLKKEQMMILRHIKGFTPEQIDAMSKKCVSLGGIRYQYENFFQWMGKILLKLKSFHKEGEKTIYCSELGAIAINTAYPGTFPTPNMTSPADHYLNFCYYVIDKNDLV